MMPKWITGSFAACELLAYDDGESLAFFRIGEEVYTLPYAYLHLCDEGSHSQLMVLVRRFGKCVPTEVRHAPVKVSQATRTEPG